MTNSENPSVAVILPVYNTARYLGECLDSLLAQTYGNFTVFAVDDGSTDGSSSILDQFAGKDGRIRAIHKQNGGVSSARNAALGAIDASGLFDLVCFVDSDDTVKPNFLKTYVDAFLTYGADYIVCGFEYFGKHGPVHKLEDFDTLPLTKITRDEAFNHLFKLNDWEKLRLPSNSWFLLNRCFTWNDIKAERFNESLRIAEDQDFLLRVMRNIENGVVLNDITYQYRFRASSLCNVPSKRFDDLEMTMALISEIESWPESARFGIVAKARSNWWQAVKATTMSGAFESHRKILDNAHRVLKKFDYKNNDKNKFNKRSTLYTMGPRLLKIYFILTNKKGKYDTSTAYD